VRITACGLALAAIVAVPALAAAPRKGAVYSGSLAGAQAKISLSFRVSSSGGQVGAVTVSALPIYCAGNPPPGTPSLVFATAKISAAGRFSSTGKDTISSGPLKGSVVATLIVSGTFNSGGRAHGTVTTSYGGSAKNCGGHSNFFAHA